MADDKIDLSKLDEYTAKLSGPLKEQMEKWSASLKEKGQLTTTLTELTKQFGEKGKEVWTEIGKISSEVMKSLDEWQKKFNLSGFNLAKTLEGIKEKFRESPVLKEGLGLKIGAIDPKELKVFEGRATLTALTVSGVLKNVSSSFEELGKSGDASASKASESFKLLSGNISAISPVAAGLIEKFGNSYDQVTKAQSAIISTMAQSGQLGLLNTTGSTKELTGQLNEITARLVQQSSEVAKSTGILPQQIAKYQQDLTKEVGAFNVDRKIRIFSGDVNQKDVDQTEALIRLAKASGNDMATVTKDMGTMYRSLNVAGTAAAENLAVMYKVTQDLGIPTDLINTKIMSMAKNLSVLGDNTKASANIMRSFGFAMKDSGLNPEDMTRLAESMTSAFSKFEPGKMAFVSGQTGGPGGLAGGFQMEYALQQGKSDEVLRKTMQAMQQQFAGPILTLKEAAANPALSGEFYKQVQYLTQVAGVAKDDRDAYRILEGMKSGMLDKIKLGEKEDPQRVLSDTMTVGNKLVQMNNTELAQLHVQLEKTTSEMHLSNTLLMRRIIGGGGENKNLINSLMRLPSINQRAKEASQRAGHSYTYGNYDTPSGKILPGGVGASAVSLNKMFVGVAEDVNSIAKGFGSVASKFKESFLDPIMGMKTSTETKTKRPERELAGRIIQTRDEQERERDAVLRARDRNPTATRLAPPPPSAIPPLPSATTPFPAPPLSNVQAPTAPNPVEPKADTTEKNRIERLDRKALTPVNINMSVGAKPVQGGIIRFEVKVTPSHNNATTGQGTADEEPI